MSIKIAITQPNRFSASETFIRNHIKHLDEYAEVHNLSGGWVPFFANEKAIFFPFLAKVEQAFAQILLRREFMQGFTARAVAAYLHKHSIQIVLAEYGPSGVAMLPICKRLGIPLVVHFHGLDAHGTDIFEQYGKAYKDVFEYASAVIGVSTHMCKRLVEMGCAQEKVHYIVYGIDTKFTDLKINLNSKNFLMVGRLVDKKAPNLTIEAFAKVVKRFPNANLRIAGDGPLLPVCKATIQKLNIAQNVHLLGVQTHEQIATLMQDTFCFVQHSVTAKNGDSEGTPVAILEASFVGLPVVATRHAGIKDVILEEQTGFLVNEFDIKSMAEKMIFLLENRTIAVAMSKAAQNFIPKNFAMTISIQKLWQILYENCLKK